MELFKTITSHDQRHRVLFWRRGDGMVQYVEEHLRDDEDQGQKYSLWTPIHPSSGLFPDEIAAEAEARHALSWLSSGNKNQSSL